MKCKVKLKFSYHLDYLFMARPNALLLHIMPAGEVALFAWCEWLREWQSQWQEQQEAAANTSDSDSDSEHQQLPVELLSAPEATQRVSAVCQWMDPNYLCC